MKLKKKWIIIGKIKILIGKIIAINIRIIKIVIIINL